MINLLGNSLDFGFTMMGRIRFDFTVSLYNIHDIDQLLFKKVSPVILSGTPVFYWWNCIIFNRKRNGWTFRSCNSWWNYCRIFLHWYLQLPIHFGLYYLHIMMCQR